MRLEFLKDAGIYLPSQDGIKFTAIVDGYARECFVTGDALVAAGANPAADPISLVAYFEQNRGVFEAAAEKALDGLQRWVVNADAVAQVLPPGSSAAPTGHPKGLRPAD